MIGLDAAVSQVPYLDNLVPTSTHNDRVMDIRREPYT